MLYFVAIKNHTIIKSLSAWCWNTHNDPASNKSLILVACFIFLFPLSDVIVHIQIHIHDQFGFLIHISKIRSLSRGCSAPPRSHSEPPHGFLLQCKHPMPYSNNQEDNFHFYIDFSYSHEIHHHMSVWIVLVYHSRDHEYHKIPENIKHNLISAQLNLSIMISIKILGKVKIL